MMGFLILGRGLYVGFVSLWGLRSRCRDNIVIWMKVFFSLKWSKIGGMYLANKGLQIEFTLLKMLVSQNGTKVFFLFLLTLSGDREVGVISRI